ncbi:MAG: hypothetical protein H7A49_15260 [Akkermansiaceae bacterium]|nr:hypothetical protein [Akkermansiaceae bacterium]
MARPKKKQHLKLATFTNSSGTESWRVTGMMPDGRRIRRNFQDRSDALRELHDLQMEIEENPEPRQALRTLLTAEQLADAESAFQQVGLGSRLSEVVAHYNSLRRRAGEMGVDLDQAMTFFETRYRPETETITILNAKEKFMGTRHDISDTTRANYEHGLGLLLSPDANKFVHAFTISDIEAILGKYRNTRSKRTYRITFSTFFRWAVRHHYCLENPCDRLDKLPRDMSQIAALSLEEAKRLIHAATIYQDRAAAAVIAIGLFAGLRPSELRDLKKEDILKDRIRVPVASCGAR